MPAKAPNNRTLTVAPDEVAALKERIVSSNSLPDAAEFRNLLINADLMQVIDNIPDGVADLIIIDPPYNLTKNFNGNTFAARSQSEYEAYLHTWFSKVCRKLKPHGSLYLCGDWKCTSALQTVMQEELTVLNRITWQREKGRGAQRNWKNSMEDIWFATAMLRTYSSLVLSNEMYGSTS